MTIRIIIAEDHAVLRATLRALLGAEPDLEVVGEAAHMAELLCLAGRVRPDIILLDISLPDLQGFEAICQLIGTLPDSQILVLTDYLDVDMVRSALIAGVSGCVLGQAAESTLVCAIRSAFQGQLCLVPSMMRGQLAELHSPLTPPNVRAAKLTRREADVLRLLAQGYTNRQTAEMLGVSVRTVECHREHLMAKLGLHSRVELVRYAAARHLIHNAE